MDVVGTITAPLPAAYAGPPGIIAFLLNILRVVFVVAGIYAFFNIILAGFTYMSAGGDSKKLESAWAKIWQSLVGLILVVASFAFAALIGQLFFGEPTFILQPYLYLPE